MHGLAPRSGTAGRTTDAASARRRGGAGLPAARLRRALRLGAPAGALVAALALAGCTPASEPPAATGGTTDATEEGPQPTASAAPGGSFVPSGEPEVLAEGLDVPWSVVVLDDGATLISERETARVLELVDGALREVGTVPGVRAEGEGGLMGLAALEAGGERWLYAMHTGADDNRIVRMPLQGEPGAVALGAPEELLTGIPSSSTHNGGRLAFGPDGKLYATTGDAQDRPSSQDAGSLGGKVLRLEPDGSVPSDNPTAGSPVYTLGHRNPQGLTWDASGQLWASEFGQDTWDELNRLEPGGNYGWPEVEGQAGAEGFVDPVVQWSPAEASPSGLAAAGDSLYLAALRGERLWRIESGEPVTTEAYHAGEFGRLRDAVLAPDGASLLVLTNNTSRDSAGPGDDRLLRIPLAPAD
ncbi:oxidoreductase [Arenivirga flava]|uniref:Oxidoreductase n=2 Tax=Arenivirga flava TaxID=1930060 RepID=A0AA37UL89_9MICO|nr:oxidoreductase [Arenivirga flava]